MGRFNITADTKVELGGDPQAGLWIFAIKFPARELLLRASSEDEMDDWVSFFHGAIVAMASLPAVHNPPVQTAPDPENLGIKEKLRLSITGATNRRIRDHIRGREINNPPPEVRRELSRKKQANKQVASAAAKGAVVGGILGIVGGAPGVALGTFDISTSLLL